MLELNELAVTLFRARQDEAKAKGNRIQCEIDIAELIETEGTKSKTVDAGEGMKIVIKRGTNYKASADAIRELDIPEEVMPITLTEPVAAGYIFDAAAYEALRDQHPDVFDAVAAVVTATPKKVSVTLKLS